VVAAAPIPLGLPIKYAEKYFWVVLGHPVVFKPEK